MPRSEYIPVSKKEWLAHLLLSAESPGQGPGKGLGGIFKHPYSIMKRIECKGTDETAEDVEMSDPRGSGNSSQTSIKANVKWQLGPIKPNVKQQPIKKWLALNPTTN